MKIDDFVQHVNTVGITGHISPDGDCAGACLALYTYLTKHYPALSVDLFLEPVSDKLSFLSNFDKIDSSYQKDMIYDVFFCIDAASLERIGKALKYFSKALKTVNIDHHISNTVYADSNFVEAEASSASEVLYGMLEPSGLDRETAICLYTGIVFDTGVFKYSCTSPNTMRAAADLMEYDIPTQQIIDDSFYAKTYRENRIYGYAIQNSRLFFEDRLICSYVSKETMKAFGVTKADLEGIVSQMLLTRGVECSVFLYDIDDHKCKVSLRSVHYVDVNRIAQKFGGGGHQRASGCTMEGTGEVCLERLLKEIETVI